MFTSAGQKPVMVLSIYQCPVGFVIQLSADQFHPGDTLERDGPYCASE